MMPLTMCKAGEENEIKKIGGKEEVRRHLENLGFVVGGKVAVISETDGNMIVNVKEARVAIGKDMANKIMIEKGSSDEDIKRCKSWRDCQSYKTDR